MIHEVGSAPVLTAAKQLDINKKLQQERVDFSKVMMNALEQVNTDQIRAEEMDRMFTLGEIDSISDVTIAAMKADLSLNIAVEVTNKVLSAYNEIMRLQL